ncbi:hypothetical protein ACQY0O_004472 [Thecaphora frezii]
MDETLHCNSLRCRKALHLDGKCGAMRGDSNFGWQLCFASCCPAQLLLPEGVDAAGFFCVVRRSWRPFVPARESGGDNMFA